MTCIPVNYNILSILKGGTHTVNTIPADLFRLTQALSDKLGQGHSIYRKLAEDAKEAQLDPEMEERLVTRLQGGDEEVIPVLVKSSESIVFATASLLECREEPEKLLQTCNTALQTLAERESSNKGGSSFLEYRGWIIRQCILAMMQS